MPEAPCAFANTSSEPALTQTLTALDHQPDPGALTCIFAAAQEWPRAAPMGITAWVIVVPPRRRRAWPWPIVVMPCYYCGQPAPDECRHCRRRSCPLHLHVELVNTPYGRMQRSQCFECYATGQAQRPHPPGA